MTPARRPAQRSSEAGFTLVELLIVMSVILILITLAIPGYEHFRITANETSAISSVRTLVSMENQYNANYPSHGFAASLVSMGGTKEASATPTPEAAQLIPEDLAAGRKQGYLFSVTGTAKSTVGSQDQYNGYNLTATPISIGKTGNRGFCADESGQIRFDPKGGTNCTELLQ